MKRARSRGRRSAPSRSISRYPCSTCCWYRPSATGSCSCRVRGRSSCVYRVMPDVIIKNLPFLLAGLRLTAEISVLSIIGGSVLGVAIGIVRYARTPVLAQLFDVYVEFVRGTPLLVVLFICYFGL